MNPRNDHFYKLNLCDLTVGQPTVEFRQYSATADFVEAGNWVRLCAAMVNNSARLRSPSCFKESTQLDDQFEMLFEYVVKDRFLRDFYRKRRADFNLMHDVKRLEVGHQREGCATSGQCPLTSRPLKRLKTNS